MSETYLGPKFKPSIKPGSSKLTMKELWQRAQAPASASAATEAALAEQRRA